MNIDQNKKNFLWNLIGLTFNSFNSFFFLIIVKRINGLESAGIFSYAFAIACLLWIVAIYYNRAYQVSKNEISDRVFIKTRLITCSIMFFLSIIISLLSISEIDKLIMIILLCLFRNIEALSDVFYGIAHKNDRLDYVGKSMFIKALMGLIVFIVLDIITKNVVISVVGLLIVNIIGCTFDYRKSKKYIKVNESTRNTRYILKNSFVVFSYSFLYIFLVNIQKYVLGYFDTNEIQAIFNIIVMPATFMSLCGQYLINPFINILNRKIIEKKYNEYDKIIKKLTITLLILGLLASLAIYIIGVPILNSIYNIDLQNYKLSLVIIVISSIFYAISAILSNALTIIKKNNGQLIIYILAALISLSISIIAIKNYHITGAVYSYGITLFTHLIMYIIYYKKSLRSLKESDYNENRD